MTPHGRANRLRMVFIAVLGLFRRKRLKLRAPIPGGNYREYAETETDLAGNPSVSNA